MASSMTSLDFVFEPEEETIRLAHDVNVDTLPSYAANTPTYSKNARNAGSTSSNTSLIISSLVTFSALSTTSRLEEPNAAALSSPTARPFSANARISAGQLDCGVSEVRSAVRALARDSLYAKRSSAYSV
jgi:hypothetical protein